MDFEIGNTEKQESRAFVFGGGETPSDILMREFSLDRFGKHFTRQGTLTELYKEQQQLRAQARKEKGTTRISDKDFEVYLKQKGKEGPILRLADIPESQQIAMTSYGEYIRKPYDQSILGSLIELNQRLKSCVSSVATNSVGLGFAIHPFGHPHIQLSDYDDAQTLLHKEQRLSLINWANSLVIGEDNFLDVMVEFVQKWKGLGEAYLEVVEDASGHISELLFADPTYIWMGVNKDRYIQMKGGEKTYFRPFFEREPLPRSSRDFHAAGTGTPIPIKELATKLIHIKETNSLSATYGVGEWSPSISGILGMRSADERDKRFFDNDAVPRMCVTVSGGTISSDTIDKCEEYFSSTKGPANAHRLLILEVVAANTNQPDWKPPDIKLWPLTVGKTDDASFLNYRKHVNESVREAFRVASIFLGTSEDINRAAAFTMREMTVNLVFAVVGAKVARLLNKTILPKWMETEHLTPETCLVEFGFALPKTMSQKDEAEILKLFASAGAYSPNDIRSYMGLDAWEQGWASIPSALAIVFAQMGLINTPSLDELTEGMDMSEDDTDKEKMRKSLLIVRRALEQFYAKDSHAGSDYIATYFRGLDNTAIETSEE